MRKPRTGQTEFHMRLKAARSFYGLTQEEVSAALHICRSTYAYYETGRTEPPLEILRDVAIFYGVSADYLLGLKSPEEEGIAPGILDPLKTLRISIGRRNT